uniref:Uncharacterized protein n=1 Tax=Molossus molossus TaxID=27622 RepID=A0A7J8HGV5_MOLMO|nr:hypothetical protein HJG59_010915 [Molossus molossus]
MSPLLALLPRASSRAPVGKPSCCPTLLSSLELCRPVLRALWRLGPFPCPPTMLLAMGLSGSPPAMGVAATGAPSRQQGAGGRVPKPPPHLVHPWHSWPVPPSGQPTGWRSGSRPLPPRPSWTGFLPLPQPGL